MATARITSRMVLAQVQGQLEQVLVENRLLREQLANMTEAALTNAGVPAIQWVWEWQPVGNDPAGYNWTTARSEGYARGQAARMESENLLVNWGTFRKAAPGEVEALDRQYAGLFN